MRTIDLNVVALDRMLYEGKVKQITVETTDGQRTLLPGHMPTASVLKDAPLIIVDEDDMKHYISVHKGYLSIMEDKLLVVADHALFAEEIDEQRIIEDIRKNKELIESGQSTSLDIDRVKVRLQRNLTDLKVHELSQK